MKKIILLLFLPTLLNCGNSPRSYLEHLDGYWEIDEVVLPDGSKRDYNYNDTIDFISISDSLIGFRKKVRPNFDGTFSTSDDVEAFKIKFENDSLNLYYTTPYANWKETILEATENRMTVKNQEDLLYIYKRYKPITSE